MPKSEKVRTGEELLRESYGMTDTKKKSIKEKDENVIYTSFVETPEYILEQIKTTCRKVEAKATLATHATFKRQTLYIIYNKKTGMIDRVKEFEAEGIIYKPITNQIYKKGIVLLPSDVKEYESTEKLAKQIKEFFNVYFEPPKFFENFLPYLCMFYWVYEKFPFIPYAHFVGRTSTGKTTAMEVFGSICYKPIDVSGSITMASIFRTTTDWGGTLLIDEFDMAGEGYRAMVSFLKSGVADRAVLRTEGDKKREVIPYAIKSPKIFTSETPVSAAGFQSRTIVIKMEKNKRMIPLYRLAGFLEEAENLRNKLLLWRLRNMDNINLKEIEFGFEELKSFDRRVQQVITPIFYLSGKGSRKNILDFALEHQKETLRERRESVDGSIFEILVEFIERKEEPPLSEILIAVNKKNLAGGYKEITAKKLGNIIRKILGFEIERKGHENISTVILEKREDKIKELREYYGLPVRQTNVASVAGVAGEARDIFDID